MKLYTLTKKEKRFRPLDKLTGAVIYDPERVYFLKPEEPTEVPDEDAKLLLAQDPHLVSTKRRSEVVVDEVTVSGNKKMQVITCPKCGGEYYVQLKGNKSQACPYCLSKNNAATEESAANEAIENGPVTRIELTPEQMDLIKQISEEDLNTWDGKKVRDAAKDLGEKIPANIKLDKQREMLLEIAMAKLPQE